MLVELLPFLRRPGIHLMERARRTEALGLLPRLLSSQWWDTGRLINLQKQRLTQLLKFCETNVPYYHDQFARLGTEPDYANPAAVLASLPILTKEAIRAAGSSLQSASFTRWQPRPKSTSGSTGIPLNYYLDRMSHSYQWGHLWRGWHQVGYQPGDPYATLSGGSLVPEKVDLKQRIYLILSGALHLPSYHLTEAIMTRYLHTLQRHRVPFLYGYPSSIELFATFVLSQDRHSLPLQAVFTTSETLAPKARDTIAAAFTCRIIDTYGCNDGGVYGFECERQEGFHLGMESVYVEIVDDEGHPLPTGQIGHIVTTNLVMRAMPLLRYATGDLGALTTESCDCGRGLVRIVNLQGRERDFVLTPSGHKVHGAFFNHFEPFYEAEWLDRFQVHQPNRQQLILKVMVNRKPSSAERDTLFAALRKGLGELDYQLEIVDSMTLTPTGKFQVIISDVT